MNSKIITSNKGHIFNPNRVSNVAQFCISHTFRENTVFKGESSFITSESHTPLPLIRLRTIQCPLFLHKVGISRHFIFQAKVTKLLYLPKHSVNDPIHLWTRPSHTIVYQYTPCHLVSAVSQIFHFLILPFFFLASSQYIKIDSKYIHNRSSICTLYKQDDLTHSPDILIF